jgi:hypothetical protein
MQQLAFSGKSYHALDLSGYDVLEQVSTDRAIFTDIFLTIKNNCGKPYYSATEFFYKHISEHDGYNFVFAMTVFMELGIFEVVNGVLRYNANVKNPLTNSKVYSKICVLKG